MAVTVTQRTPRTLGRANRVLITGTTAQTMLTVTPTVTQQCQATGYLVVQSAATTVTVTLGWTDPDTGTAETYDWYNASNLAVGVYPLGAVAVMVRGGTPVTVSVTASAANTVIASATVQELR